MSKIFFRFDIVREGPSPRPCCIGLKNKLEDTQNSNVQNLDFFNCCPTMVLFATSETKRVSESLFISRPGGTGPVGAALAGPTFRSKHSFYQKIVLLSKNQIFKVISGSFLRKLLPSNAPNCILENLNFQNFQGICPGPTS